MNPFDVIERPVLSEKSNDCRESIGQYVFDIKMKATKHDVSKAVKAMWDVDVEKVRTYIRRGKIKRRGMQMSQQKSFKRAVVTLVEGAKLPLFEEQ